MTPAVLCASAPRGQPGRETDVIPDLAGVTRARNKAMSQLVPGPPTVPPRNDWVPSYLPSKVSPISSFFPAPPILTRLSRVGRGFPGKEMRHEAFGGQHGLVHYRCFRESPALLVISSPPPLSPGFPRHPEQGMEMETAFKGQIPAFPVSCAGPPSFHHPQAFFLLHLLL